MQWRRDGEWIRLFCMPACFCRYFLQYHNSVVQDKCGQKFFVHKIWAEIRVSEDEKMLLTLTVRSISCYFGVKTLLQGLLNSNSHGDGHTDHGVVAGAQEAHHLNVKSACRRLFACGAGTFGAGSPTFHKTRSTSQESSMLCFPSMGTSYHILCSRNNIFGLN